MTSTSHLRISFSGLPLALLAASLCSCGSSGPSQPTGTAMLDANNYMSTQHDLNIPVITTAAGMDLSLDWSGIMKDLLCHPVLPTDIKSVTFAQVPMTNKTIA